MHVDRSGFIPSEEPIQPEKAKAKIDAKQLKKTSQEEVGIPKEEIKGHVQKAKKAASPTKINSQISTKKERPSHKPKPKLSSHKYEPVKGKDTQEETHKLIAKRFDLTFEGKETSEEIGRTTFDFEDMEDESPLLPGASFASFWTDIISDEISESQQAINEELPGKKVEKEETSDFDFDLGFVDDLIAEEPSSPKSTEIIDITEHEEDQQPFFPGSSYFTFFEHEATTLDSTNYDTQKNDLVETLNTRINPDNEEVDVEIYDDLISFDFVDEGRQETEAIPRSVKGNIIEEFPLNNMQSIETDSKNEIRVSDTYSIFDDFFPEEPEKEILSETSKEPILTPIQHDNVVKKELRKVVIVDETVNIQFHDTLNTERYHHAKWSKKKKILVPLTPKTAEKIAKPVKTEEERLKQEEKMKRIVVFDKITQGVIGDLSMQGRTSEMQAYAQRYISPTFNARFVFVPTAIWLSLVKQLALNMDEQSKKVISLQDPNAYKIESKVFRKALSNALKIKEKEDKGSLTKKHIAESTEQQHRSFQKKLELELLDEMNIEKLRSIINENFYQVKRKSIEEKRLSKERESYEETKRFIEKEERPEA